MSYYYNRKYSFSDHCLVRIKSRLNLDQLTDIEVINHCLNLIALSHDVLETKSFKYFKVNMTNLYFIIRKDNNLILTLSPIKPDRLLTILDDNQ